MQKSDARREVPPNPIPYGRQWLGDDDIAAVVEVLRSDWLTTGPLVESFERDVAAFTGAGQAVAVSNGTAALHAAMHALRIGPGDEVIVPALTFVASANCVVFQGGTPVFADVDPGTLLLDPAAAEKAITSHTRAIIAVDYAGQPCDYDALQAVAAKHHVALVADACHSLGAVYRSRKVGTLADITVFSFHPVKHITTGEGGMIVTDNPDYAVRARRFRNHGITSDHRQRAERGSWVYEMVELGYNYRLTDIQCALGQAQLRKLPVWLERRREIACAYGRAFGGLALVHPLGVRDEVLHAYHLYVVRLAVSQGVSRQAVFDALRAAGVSANVHYLPAHLHPFYRARLGTGPGLCPAAEAAYQEMLSLPMFPRMSDEDVGRVIAALRESLGYSA